jgi:hypothetical protein
MPTDNTDIDDIREQIVGESGISVSVGLAAAVRSFTSGPVEAFAVDIDNGNVETVYWLQGDAIGRLTVHREQTAGMVWPVSAVRAVKLSAHRTGDHFRPQELVRSISISFADGNDASINPRAHQTRYLRDSANRFIDAVLGKISAVAAPA